MKTLLYTTTATLLLATATVAQDQLRQEVSGILDNANLNVDVDNLTDDQVAEIYALSQGNGAERTKYLGVLEGYGYQSMPLGEETIFMQGEGDMAEFPENELRDQVALKLDTYGYDVEAESLTDDQVAKIYAIVQNPDDQAVRAKIDSILQ